MKREPHKGLCPQSLSTETFFGFRSRQCNVHSLNLAIGHAREEPLIRNMLSTVQAIAFAFDYSATASSPGAGLASAPIPQGHAHHHALRRDA